MSVLPCVGICQEGCLRLFQQFPAPAIKFIDTTGLFCKTWNYDELGNLNGGMQGWMCNWLDSVLSANVLGILPKPWRNGTTAANHLQMLRVEEGALYTIGQIYSSRLMLNLRADP